MLADNKICQFFMSDGMVNKNCLCVIGFIDSSHYAKQYVSMKLTTWQNAPSVTDVLINVHCERVIKPKPFVMQISAMLVH